MKKANEKNKNNEIKPENNLGCNFFQFEVRECQMPEKRNDTCAKCSYRTSESEILMIFICCEISNPILYNFVFVFVSFRHCLVVGRFAVRNLLVPLAENILISPALAYSCKYRCSFRIMSSQSYEIDGFHV